MIALSSINTSNSPNSSSTSGLPAACDYASMYCNNTAHDLTSNKEPSVEIVNSKNLTLKNKALLAFRDKCYPSHVLDEIASHHKPKDIRDYITLHVHPFNNACHRDLSVRGGSKDFWQAVIKWCANR
ncbi:hypothetical protein [Nostoc sp. DedQUE09]|uniref:hypothetical protein n=1 Tax=Nostoc sp. DedQUE09 TaxID=3075394 RepID=UPI002AD529A9|nr:hypothetical protein [Nostoc sp. DedQUE09]MDZ7951282.1 hypothetical protein [Nostoc sp. DedQUE09]